MANKKTVLEREITTVSGNFDVDLSPEHGPVYRKDILAVPVFHRVARRGAWERDRAGAQLRCGRV